MTQQKSLYCAILPCNLLPVHIYSMFPYMHCSHDGLANFSGSFLIWIHLWVGVKKIQVTHGKDCMRQKKTHCISVTTKLSEALICSVRPRNIFLSHPALFLLENQCFTKDFQWTGWEGVLCSFLILEIHSWVLSSQSKGHLLVWEQLLMKSLIIQMTAVKSCSCAWIF